AQVEVRNSNAVILRGLTTGNPVPEQIGFKYATIDPPSTHGVASGAIKKGKTQRRAVFSADGAVLLKVGDPAPGIAGAKVAKLGQVNGDAVLATVKGGVKAANNVVLFTGLSSGSLEIVARTGTVLPSGAK